MGYLMLLFELFKKASETRKGPEIKVRNHCFPSKKQNVGEITLLQKFSILLVTVSDHE